MESNMKLEIGGKCECGCGRRDFFKLEIRSLKAAWIEEYGHCVFVSIGNRYWRFNDGKFSSGGQN